MRTYLRKNSGTALGIFILLLGVSFSYVIFAQSGEVSSSQNTGITFPIAELGNCASKDECKTYCNDVTHIDACTAFASAHGLMNQDEVKSAKLFKDTLLQGGGPGGCKTPSECAAFCDDIKNIEACVAFGKEHGLKGGDLKTGEKISAYIKAGGVMPGGCDSRQACEAYCKDLSHADECHVFALKVGLVGKDKNENGSASSTLQKLTDLASRGETPGGCKSKDECRAYCSDSAHKDECIAFGKKVGFIKSEDEQKFKDLGGKGPGGCDSESACETYCNDATHRDECFKFAKDNGLISPEKLQAAKDGLVRLREGLDNAPPEVAACIKSTLGEDVVSNVESGEVTPGADTTGKVRDCFKKFGHSASSSEAFKDAPKEVAACIKDKLGDRFQVLQGGTSGLTPEEADSVRVCFGKQHFMNDVGKNHGGEGSSTPNFKKFLQDAPADLKNCIESTLGIKLDDLQAGAAIDTSKLKACFESFRPKSKNELGHEGDGQGNNMSGGFSSSSDGRPPRGPAGNLPDSIKACLQEKLGADFSPTQGGEPSEEVKNAMRACANAPGDSQGNGQSSSTQNFRNFDEKRDGSSSGTPPFRGGEGQGPRPPFDNRGSSGTSTQSRPSFGENPLNHENQFDNSRPPPILPNSFHPSLLLDKLLGSVFSIFSSIFSK
jgi:hypothetical protein